MCTVVIRVPEPGRGPVRILAIRDEDPLRPWRPLGQWWPALPQVEGILDESAGGAWLAHDDTRLAVLLNRDGGSDAASPTSRGSLVLDAVSGATLPDPLTTLGFNLVKASAEGVSITSWEGGAVRTVELAPGTHMMAHDDVDDPATARVSAWRHAFADAPTDGPNWWAPWLEVLRQSADLSPTDDRAIIRDNRPHGYPTKTLLVCAASLSSSGVDASMATLDTPGQWNDVTL